MSSLVKPPPPELNEIMQALSETATIVSLEFWSMGWVAHLEVEKNLFKLVSDRGYIDAYKIVDGAPQHILPPENQRMSISPSQMVVLIRNQFL
ncbi:MAG: hypothetical protein U0Z26_09160 [Anaerolineales bacterium]